MDKIVRIDQMHHCHEDTVLLLNNKVVIKGQTCVLRLLISLIYVHVRGFILVYLFDYPGKSSCLASIDL
jgi:hypothetical protein